MEPVKIANPTQGLRLTRNNAEPTLATKDKSFWLTARAKAVRSQLGPQKTRNPAALISAMPSSIFKRMAHARIKSNTVANAPRYLKMIKNSRIESSNAHQPLRAMILIQASMRIQNVQIPKRAANGKPRVFSKDASLVSIVASPPNIMVLRPSIIARLERRRKAWRNLQQ